MEQVSNCSQVIAIAGTEVAGCCFCSGQLCCGSTACYGSARLHSTLLKLLWFSFVKGCGQYSALFCYHFIRGSKRAELMLNVGVKTQQTTNWSKIIVTIIVSTPRCGQLTKCRCSSIWFLMKGSKKRLSSIVVCHNSFT